ncbi:hypothetical protein CCACVL1_00060, partial [Corchorus capsularis]
VSQRKRRPTDGEKRIEEREGRRERIKRRC